MQGLIQQNATPNNATLGRLLVVTATGGIPPLAQQLAQQLNLDTEAALLAHNLPHIDPERPYAAALVITEDAHLPTTQLVVQWTAQAAKLGLNALVIDHCHVCDNGLPLDGAILAQPDESLDMLLGRLATLLDLRKTLNGLASEIQRLKLLNEPLGSHFAQVDEEMRLAARLQRDFLPRELPQVPHLRFATIYRPASWVSGDIYDVMRLDEEHIGFYVADAVGHGMPAALLTMFIKRALVTKRIEGRTYSLVDPGNALKSLNDDMIQQDLSSFQFVTCCYGFLNTKTLRLRIASAGHPAPMRINKKGQMTELDVGGSLLGVFPEQKFETATAQLHPGDKLLLYSDGVEVAFVNEGPDEPLRFRKEFGSLADLDIQTMCDKLVQIIDREEGSLHPQDDVTIVGLQLDNP